MDLQNHSQIILLKKAKKKYVFAHEKRQIYYKITILQ